MSGNTLGTLFTVTNFGESHGPAIGCVVDGCPGLELDAADIQRELDRRRPGTSRHVTQRQEADQVEILSGVYEGVTTGTPSACSSATPTRAARITPISPTPSARPRRLRLLAQVRRARSRGGGRSSARLTAPTVAAGAIAKKWLAECHGVRVRGYMSQLGPIPIPFVSWDEVPNNPFYAPNADIVPELEAYMDQLRRDGDSVGARIEVVAENLPAGWGEPIYDRLDADIAHVMMGLNAVKGVSIGAGFDCIAQRGSEHGDEITPDGFLSNNAGGVLGGISTGQPVTVSLAIKPTSSIRVERQSVNRANEPVMVQTLGRHDPCVGIRATPIAEAMLALVLIDHALRHRAQCADVSV